MPTIPERLRRYSESCVTERLDADFAAAVSEAAYQMERDAEQKRTVYLTEDAVFLVTHYPHIINDLAARMREKLEARLDDIVLYGRRDYERKD